MKFFKIIRPQHLERQAVVDARAAEAHWSPYLHLTDLQRMKLGFLLQTNDLDDTVYSAVTLRMDRPKPLCSSVSQ